MDAPRVSIIIPNFDNGRASSLSGRDLIGELFASLERTLASDPTSYEIVVADDGSTDDSLATCRAWAGKRRPDGAPFLRLIELEHSGVLSQVLNRLERESRGEFLARLDGDVVLLTDAWLSKLVAMFEADPTLGVVAAAQLLPDGKVHAFGDDLWGPRGYRHIGRGARLDQLPEEREVDHVMGCFYMTRRAVHETVGGYDETVLRGQTEEYGVRVRLAGWRVKATSRVAFEHRHVDRLPRANKADRAESLEAALDRFQAKWGFDRLAPDLAAVRARYQGTPLWWREPIARLKPPREDDWQRLSQDGSFVQQLKEELEFASRAIRAASGRCVVTQIGSGCGCLLVSLARGGVMVEGVEHHGRACDLGRELLRRVSEAGISDGREGSQTMSTAATGMTAAATVPGPAHVPGPARASAMQATEATATAAAMETATATTSATAMSSMPATTTATATAAATATATETATSTTAVAVMTPTAAVTSAMTSPGSAPTVATVMTPTAAVTSAMTTTGASPTVAMVMTPTAAVTSAMTSPGSAPTVATVMTPTAAAAMMSPGMEPTAPTAAMATKPASAMTSPGAAPTTTTVATVMTPSEAVASAMMSPGSAPTAATMMTLTAAATPGMTSPGASPTAPTVAMVMTPSEAVASAMMSPGSAPTTATMMTLTAAATSAMTSPATPMRALTTVAKAGTPSLAPAPAPATVSAAGAASVVAPRSPSAAMANSTHRPDMGHLGGSSDRYAVSRQMIAVDDLAELPIAEGSRAIVLLFGVIERYWNPVGLLREVRRITAPKGVVMVRTKLRTTPLDDPTDPEHRFTVDEFLTLLRHEGGLELFGMEPQITASGWLECALQRCDSRRGRGYFSQPVVPSESAGSRPALLA